MSIERIRNFCIIAHIDHGKSTLADRFIERAMMVSERDFQDQILDTMDIERERGITIKSQAITIPYTASDGQTYILNLVDTPGHVDFTYEVSRALAACEGALLLIDAAQGVQAQTLSNLYLALEHDLEVIPVVNKIDLPSADIPSVLHQINHDLGLDPDGALLVSGKTGEGVGELLDALVRRVPAPSGSTDAPTRALIFDSHYDAYRGVVVHIRLMDGSLRAGQQIRFWAAGVNYKIEETGVFKIHLEKREVIEAGEVGYVIAGIKTVADVRTGDTITDHDRPCEGPLEGFRSVKPVVFSSIYPVDANDYGELATGLEKLKLNDASLIYEKDSSIALGFGFRCGFLGLLHLEIIQERLEREFDLSIVFTSPSVRYQVTLNDGTSVAIDNPSEYPDPINIAAATEPYIKATIITPSDYLGPIISLCLEKRGTQTGMTYLDEKRVELIYELPLGEIVFDFYDRLKSISRGYASFDYEVIDYRDTELVKLEILINGEPVDALSSLIFHGNAYARARQVCNRLKDEIPRHQFKIPIQGAIGGSIIARETISALRKDVTAKCYGGDITRKKKLLEKQKAGKRRMKTVGQVQLPQSAFLSVLKTSDE